MVPWTPLTVLDPHWNYKPEDLQDEMRRNGQNTWSKWLLCGCVISGSTAVRTEYKAKLQASTLQHWLDCQPLLRYTHDGKLIAKAWEWIALLHAILTSSTH
jgi:hypothetical protein